MSKTTIAPYLFFKGNAKEAMEFYKTVFGGELKVQTMGDVPENVRAQAGNPPADSVMHARLDSDNITIFASDSQMASDKAAKIELSINGDDEESLTAIFNKLVEGGEVRMQLSKMFWGDKFGSLRDKYGIEWMVNILSANNQA